MPRPPMPRHDGPLIARRVAHDAPPGDLDVQARERVIFDTGLGRRLTQAEVVGWLQERAPARARRERPPHPVAAATRAARARCSRLAERFPTRWSRVPDAVAMSIPFAFVLIFCVTTLAAAGLAILLGISTASEWLFGVDLLSPLGSE